MAPNRRERELARRRYERQAAKRAELARRKRRRTLTAVGAAAVVIVLAVVGTVIGVKVSGGGSSASTLSAAKAKPSTGASASASPGASPAGTSSAASSPASPGSSAGATPVADTRPLACGLAKPETHADQTYSAEPPLTVNAAKTYTMTITTPCGVITASLDVKGAPHTVNSFAFLAAKKFFDGTECHRVTTSASLSVLQCGDPTGTGTGGPGYKFADENLANAKYTRGTLAMANSGANTNGSQFFLVDKDSTLGKDYTVFGHITAGLGSLDRVITNGVAGGGTDGKPAKRVFLTSVAVTAS